LHALTHYKKVAADIRIVHEKHPTEGYGMARAWLREAKVICFLGFGFHPTNVERLGLIKEISGRSGVFVGGTAKGLDDAEIQRAWARLAIGGQTHLFAVDALTYLQKYAPLG